MPRLHKLILLAVVSCSLCLALPCAARADVVTLNFDELDAGSALSNQYSALGVLFSNSAGPLEVQADPLAPPFTPPNSILPFNFTVAGSFNQATFLVPVSRVSVTLGDLGFDEDVLHLELYDSSDALLASEVVVLSASVSGGLTLNASATNVAYARFYGVGAANNSVYFDNFSYTVVPEPATMLLLSTGLAGVGAAVRKRRRAGKGEEA